MGSRAFSSSMALMAFLNLVTKPSTFLVRKRGARVRFDVPIGLEVTYPPVGCGDVHEEVLAGFAECVGGGGVAAAGRGDGGRGLP